jgi:hypothetical protein
MTQLPNLGAHPDGKHIVGGQNDKETTSNSLDDLLDNSSNGTVDVDCSAGGTIVVSATDFSENYRLNLTGTPAADFTLELPATKRRFFAQNQTGRNVTLQVSGGASPSLTVSADAAVPVFGDGVGFHSGSVPDLLSYPLAAVDGASDSFLFWDASAGNLARVLGDDLPSGRNALVGRGSNLSVADASDQIVPWDTEIQDDFGLHDPVTNNTRLTVPSGASLVRLSANIEWAAAASGHRDLRLLKNGLNFAGAALVRGTAISASLGLLQNSTSPVLVAAPGDYFELQIRQESGAALDLVSGDHSWFSMEIVA